MAEFVGTIEEFNRYIGPRIRNVINVIAKSERKSRNGICEHCGAKAELQSAHIKGHERTLIIKDVLSNYKDGESIDINEVESEIINRHYPIKEKFLFICKSCHTKYDAKDRDELLMEHEADENLEIKDIDIISDEIEKVKTRVSNWFENRDQINSTILLTFLSMDNKDGRVNISDLEKKCSLGDKFKTNFSQMINMSSKNHGKVFSVADGEVELWSEVKSFILDFYKKSNS